jgi:hypothetical protein
MILADLLTRAGLFVILDTQAKHRRNDPPETVTVFGVGNEDTLGTIAQAASMYPSPTLLVLSSGQVMVTAEVGKAGIAVQGDLDQMTEPQSEAVSIATQVLSDFFGIAPVKTTSKKRTTKTPSEVTSDPQTSDQVVEGTETPEVQETSSESVSEVAQVDPSDQ